VRLLVILLLLSAPLVAGCAHRASPESDIEAARALFTRNIEAIQHKDQAAYLSCYRQDASLVRNGPEGPTMGFDGLAAGTSTVPASWPTSLEAKNLELHWIGPGLVYGSYRYLVSYAGDVFEGISERMFTERDGRWEIAVTTAFGLPASSDPRLERVAFLAGAWAAKEDGRTTEETWSHARAGTMMGNARTIVGDRTVHFEHMRIELTGDDIELVASPSRQPTTRFRLVASGEGFAVFENPTHGFPRRITYRRDGKKLHARAEGPENKTADWTYERR
jgi:hypothetical protein